jgi:hypothetical protein
MLSSIDSSPRPTVAVPFSSAFLPLCRLLISGAPSTLPLSLWPPPPPPLPLILSHDQPVSNISTAPPSVERCDDDSHRGRAATQRPTLQPKLVASANLYLLVCAASRAQMSPHAPTTTTTRPKSTNHQHAKGLSNRISGASRKWPVECALGGHRSSGPARTCD